MKRFDHTITKKDIQNFISTNKAKATPEKKWTVVEQIQVMKEDSIKRLIKWFSQPEIKCIDPGLIKWVEKEYFKFLKDDDWEKTCGQNINPLFDSSALAKESENMFKKHEFDPNYIGKFDQLRNQNFLDISKTKIIARYNELVEKSLLGKQETEELATIRMINPLLNTKNIENTKSRTIYFDEKEFVDTAKPFAIECFFEQDSQWHKHYFSLNQLLNDLETFGVESGYPVLDTQNLGKYSKAFGTIQRDIKLALIKSILAKYRDYQEILMYDLVDFEKNLTGTNIKSKSWLLAEKAVEWAFRNYAVQDERYTVTIKKASVGEDQIHKIDLIVELQDKKSGVNIQKELQLTINNDKHILEKKRLQTLRKKNMRDVDIDLLHLELSLLAQKVTVWRNLGRPIGWLSSFLTIEDKEFFATTYKRIVQELQEKIQ